MPLEHQVSKTGKEYYRCTDCWMIENPQFRDPTKHECPRSSEGVVFRRKVERTFDGRFDEKWECTGCGAEEEHASSVDWHSCPPGKAALAALMEAPVAEALDHWAKLRVKDFAVELCAWMQQRYKEAWDEENAKGEDGDLRAADHYGHGMADVTAQIKEMLLASGLVPVEEEGK